MFECRIDESDLGEPTKPERVPNVRDAAQEIWGACNFARACLLGTRRFSNFRICLRYSFVVHSRKRRTPMDVEKMVDLWVPVIKALCMAHSKEEIDRAEFAMEDLLNPLLTAPVRDLRKFYTKLVQCLKADTTIPFFVWAAFDAWEEVVVKPAPDADIKMLKNELAKEIADMVEEQVRPDIGKAIAGALRWRDPETLEKMRASLKEGKPAKVRGRESCLFLEVEDHCVML